MSVARPTLRERLGGALAAGVIVGGLGYLLIVGLAGSQAVVTTEALKLFSVLPPPPPPPPEPPPRSRPHSQKPNGGAAPPNIVSKATEVTIPIPLVVIPPPPPYPVVAAPTPATGADPTSGATDKPGPGTGAGGEGNGTGSGTGGNGDGAGRAVVGPRQIAGRITHKDFPEDAPTTGIGGTVGTRYFVMPDGTVSDCRVIHSSGSPQLDELTCRLITERFRYRPARDADGRPTRVIFERDDEWVNEYKPSTAPAPQQGR